MSRDSSLRPSPVPQCATGSRLPRLVPSLGAGLAPISRAAPVGQAEGGVLLAVVDVQVASCHHAWRKVPNPCMDPYGLRSRLNSDLCTYEYVLCMYVPSRCSVHGRAITRRFCHQSYTHLMNNAFDQPLVFQTFVYRTFVYR